MVTATYAVVKIGGKQYTVQPGDNIDVELLDAPPGDILEFNEVLTLSRDGKTVIGAPLVAGARVTADVVRHGRDRKIIVFHFKAKVRFRKKQGHRQSLTRLTIKEIIGGPVPVEAA